MSARRSLFAVVCAGQGEQAALDFAALRPGPAADPAAHELWRSASGQVGCDWAAYWQALPLAARSANLEAQRAVVLFQALRWLDLRTRLPAPDWVVGYSVGELTAHAIAGSLPWRALPALVVARARAMDGVAASWTAAHGDALPTAACLLRAGGPLPPAASERRRQALLRHGLQLAIRRGPADHIWGGPPAALAAMLAEADAPHWQLRVIDVRCPSHTSWMAPALPAWSAALDAAAVQAPAIGILAGISAARVRDAAAVRATLLAQLATPLCWEEVLQALAEHGVGRLLDLGPGSDQTRLIRDQLPALQLLDAAAVQST
ncbi:MAG: hypothetical protein KGI67_03255 [Pseudomonadota bacterium]|nr:hypothetical protein [Pseudomonadota bacterium]